MCFKTISIVPGPKHSPPTYLNNCHPVEFVPIVMKFFEQLLMAKLKRCLLPSDLQLSWVPWTAGVSWVLPSLPLALGRVALLHYYPIFFITLFLLLPYFSSTVMVLGHITQHFEFMMFSCLRPVMMPVAFLSPVESLWSFTSCVYLVCQFSFISHLSILLCHAMIPGLWNDASSSLHVSGFPC